MAYPVDGASYKNTPKFIDRMKSEEGKKSGPYTQSRDDGGPVDKASTDDKQWTPPTNDMMDPVSKEGMEAGENPEWKVQQNYQSAFHRRAGTHSRGGKVK